LLIKGDYVKIERAEIKKATLLLFDIIID